jgi:anti-sigma B factor antagonist
MDAERLRVEIEASGGGTSTIHLHGDIDIDADVRLPDAYARATAGGQSRIVLDFADVGYINSTGIALIVRLLAEARRDHREVLAVHLSAHYQEIFRLTRLSDYVTITDATPEADQLEGVSR